MLRSKLKMDFREFNRGMQLTKRIFVKHGKKGLGKAGAALMDDTVTGMPTAPLLLGYLRGSGSVFVDNKLIAMSKHGLPDYVATVCTLPLKSGEIKAIVLFNVPYAARWHETLPKSGAFSEPSAGIYYMSSKMLANLKKYRDIIAESLRKGV